MKSGNFRRGIFISAFGYALDLYDLFIIPAFSDVMLRDLGVASTAIRDTYLSVMSWQLWGAALGAVLLWGPLSDRFGRKAILITSILIYSLASIWTAFVHSLPELVAARTISGLGLGAELGAAVTLLAEGRTGAERSANAKIIGFIGMLGVVAVGLLGWSGKVSWRGACGIAGLCGLVLMLVRQNLDESSLFKANQERNRTVDHLQALRALFLTKRFGKLLLAVLVGTPTFFVTGLLVPRAKDYALATHMQVVPSAALALSWTYLFISLGDYACGQLSTLVQSRRYSLLAFHLITLVGVATLLFYPPMTAGGFYLRCALTGFGIGYWANMTLAASELFGTNLRGTVTVAVPNLVRLLLFPISWALAGSFGIPGLAAKLGLMHAYMVIGFACCAIAIAAVLALPETYHKDMDYNEEI